MLEAVIKEFYDPFTKEEIHDEEYPQGQGKYAEELEYPLCPHIICPVENNNQAYGPDQEKSRKYNYQNLLEKLDKGSVPSGPESEVTVFKFIEEEPYVEAEYCSGNKFPEEFNPRPEPEEEHCEPPE